MKITVPLQLREVCEACDMQHVSFFSLFGSSLSPFHVRTLQTWGRATKRKAIYLWPSTMARKSERTALTVWYRKALFALHCSRVFQFGSKAMVYQPWSKATVSLVACTTESYLSFLQLCTQYNLPHPPFSPLLLSHFIVTFLKGLWKYYAVLHYI